MDGYVRYLAGHYRFRAGIEQLLAQASFPDWFEGWRPLLLAGALRADLDALGIEPPAPSDGAPADRLASAAGLVGVLYVLEGAALGARFLRRCVQGLGLTAETGARHLDLQTGGESWQGFLDLLGRASIDREEAAEAAVATFALARGAFAKEPDEQP